MSKFRKKPVEIEAILFDGSWSSASDVMAWMHKAGDAHLATLSPPDDRPGKIEIHTLEGVMTASPGDWIIRGVKGEHYPCKPDIFAATYDAVEADWPPGQPTAAESEAEQSLPPRVFRIERLMANLEQGIASGRGVDTMQEARQLILDLLGMSEKPVGESIYDAVVKEAEKYGESEGTVEELLVATKFAKRWLPEAFEASDQGQVAFGRAVCDSLVSASEAYLKKAGQNVESE